MAAGKQQTVAEKNAELYARMTAPAHVTQNHFKEHRRIDGYFENRDVPDFMGSDRLLKWDTLYGTIQLGYNPQKGQSFIFANIKTSIFDNAPSRHQRELKEYQMMRMRKTGNQNLAYLSKRRANSAVILYKKDNMPWSPRSVAPYLHRLNAGTLLKTMPFLDKSAEREERAQLRQERRELEQQVRESLKKREYDKLAQSRAAQTELSERQNTVNSLLWRKDAQSRLFFRKLNMAYDLQKHEIFDYYRSRRLGGAAAQMDNAPPQDKNKDEDQDQDE